MLQTLELWKMISAQNKPNLEERVILELFGYPPFPMYLTLKNHPLWTNIKSPSEWETLVARFSGTYVDVTYSVYSPLGTG